jgi:hypothetical protein
MVSTACPAEEVTDCTMLPRLSIMKFRVVPPWVMEPRRPSTAPTTVSTYSDININLPSKIERKKRREGKRETYDTSNIIQSCNKKRVKI